MRIIALIAALAVSLVTPATAQAGWTMPLAGAEVAAPFRYSSRTPFVVGQRRGVDLRAPRASTVRAVCSGAVRHAGPLPSGRLGVSIACGSLIATELGLAHVSANAGRRVRSGAAIGTIAAGTTLRLGARRAGSRWGYIDPMRLIGPDRGPIPVAPVGSRRVTRRVVSPYRTKRAELRRAPAATPALAPQIALGLGAALILIALLVPALRRRADSLRVQHGLLRNYADLLRQRRAASRARVHDDRRRRARASSPSAR